MDSDTCLYLLTLINSKRIPISIISILLREFGSLQTLMELHLSKL